ncbi:MAG TPA: hypothetical protein VK083_23035 [Nocardia sp.]|uniref:hypothetical protein n=1 Tax=Nocardia TaxID=1817 RepID=UPI002456E479|nr:MULTISPECIES: hypothetical protein [Nocardia]HLS79669.1 hypothetical protein [Nocardia sp.]
MTTPEDARPGIDLGKAGSGADTTGAGFGGVGDQVAGTPPSAYPSYPSYPSYPAPPATPVPQPPYGAPFGFAAGGYPGQPGTRPPVPPYTAPSPPAGHPYPGQAGPAQPYSGPPPGAYVPPPAYSPPGMPTPHGYVETQTQIFSIISFSLAAAGVLALLTMCGLPALVTGPAGIVLGIVGHNKRESLGVAAAVTNALIMIPLVLVLIFVAGAFWSV